MLLNVLYAHLYLTYFMFYHMFNLCIYVNMFLEGRMVHSRWLLNVLSSLNKDKYNRDLI